jgi:hypothetical protein
MPPQNRANPATAPRTGLNLRPIAPAPVAQRQTVHTTALPFLPEYTP